MLYEGIQLIINNMCLYFTVLALYKVIIYIMQKDVNAAACSRFIQLTARQLIPIQILMVRYIAVILRG